MLKYLDLNPNDVITFNEDSEFLPKSIIDLVNIDGSTHK